MVTVKRHLLLVTHHATKHPLLEQKLHVCCLCCQLGGCRRHDELWPFVELNISPDGISVAVAMAATSWVLRASVSTASCANMRALVK